MTIGAAAAILASPSPAHAVEPTCKGRPATAVVTSQADADNAGTPAGDVVYVDAEGITLRTGDGDDTVCAGPGVEGYTRVWLGTGNDTVSGFAIGDLRGWDGNDRIELGDAGFSEFNAIGGSGVDRLTWSGCGPRVDVVEHQWTCDRTSLGSITAIEKFTSDGRYVDDFYGSTANEEFRAGPGNDTIHGRGGDDLLVGGDGDDKAYGGPGDDECRKVELAVSCR